MEESGEESCRASSPSRECDFEARYVELHFQFHGNAKTTTVTALMRRRALLAAAVVIVSGLLLLITFVAGVEIGHRHGYDMGWRDCKFDDKQSLMTTNFTEEVFWHWHGHAPVVIRKHRGFFAD